MKKWFGIIAAVLASGVLALTSVSVLADSGQSNTGAPASAIIPGLAIQAPRVAPVGEEVTITVSDRLTQEAVKDAGVWALTRDGATALREEVTSLREQGIPPREVDFESLVGAHGTFLGTTNGHGQLKHTFNEPGGYLLVAVKSDYLPGFARICIKDIAGALAIQAPRAAPVGEQVTITVSDRLTQEAVKDAGVWALTRGGATALREEVTSLREQGIPPREVDFESLVGAHGTFLGTTNGHGQLKHTFNEPGGYLLVAVKSDYLPGFARILVTAP